MNDGAFCVSTLAHGAVLCHPFHGFVGNIIWISVDGIDGNSGKNLGAIKSMIAYIIFFILL